MVKLSSLTGVEGNRKRALQGTAEGRQLSRLPPTIVASKAPTRVLARQRRFGRSPFAHYRRTSKEARSDYINKKYSDFGAVTIKGVGHYPMLEEAGRVQPQTPGRACGVCDQEVSPVAPVTGRGEEPRARRRAAPARCAGVFSGFSGGRPMKSITESRGDVPVSGQSRLAACRGDRSRSGDRELARKVARAIGYDGSK
jgi:hypothetical protein